ncbi:hypothetical protein BJX70DRAFT_357510 [Aspergillus crustosus]
MLKRLGNFIRFPAIATLAEADAFSEVVGLPPEALEQFVAVVLQGATVEQLHGLRSGEYHKSDKVMPGQISQEAINQQGICDIVSLQPLL